VARSAKTVPGPGGRGQLDLRPRSSFAEPARPERHHLLSIRLPPDTPNTPGAVGSHRRLMQNSRGGHPAHQFEVVFLAPEQDQGVGLAIVLDAGDPSDALSIDAEIREVTMQGGVDRLDATHQGSEDIRFRWPGWSPPGLRFRRRLLGDERREEQPKRKAGRARVSWQEQVVRILNGGLRVIKTIRRNDWSHRLLGKQGMDADRNKSPPSRPSKVLAFAHSDG